MLNKNANRQIYSESRAVGLTLFDRLLNIESNLFFTSQHIMNKADLDKYYWLTKMFDSIYILEKGKPGKIILGQDTFEIDLTEKQKKHLKGKGLLTIVNKDKGFYPLVLVSINAEEDKYIVGNVNLSYFWSIYVNGNDVFCVVIDKTKLVFCSDGKNDINKNAFDEAGKLIDFKNNAKDEPYSISINQKEYAGNIWDLFLEPQYGVESFSILYFIRKNEAFFSYDFYKNVFPKSLLITLLIVYLLSSVQMRRSLVPLQKLTKGVKSLMAGNYGVKIEIESNNEFQTLAKTFNKMSSQIEVQFLKINTLSKIDRLILSASEVEYISEVLLEYMPNILPGNSFALLIFNNDLSRIGLMYYFEDAQHKKMNKTNLVVEEKDYMELGQVVDIIKSDAGDKAYFSLAKSKGCTSFLAYPIHDKERMLGVILIGAKSEFEEKHGFFEGLKEVSDRAAVAISNAQWEKKLRYQAHFDALTNLPNRYLFKDRLEQSIVRAKRNDLSVAVLFLDLDRFKSINDSLGHAVGDELLVKVSEVLLTCVRAYDSVSRFGGDEYTIVLSDIPKNEAEEKAEQLADRILSKMSEPFIIDDREFFISPSIGISVFPKDANNFNDLLKNSDSAMYKAKTIPSGAYEFYQPIQNSEVLKRMEMEVELRHALKENQFELVFQPKINLVQNKIIGVEALARWNHPSKGVITPGIFIPVAEESGLIKSIGYWVLKEACALNKAWQDNGVFLTTAINVSAEQFKHTDFLKKLNEILDETKVTVQNIELEVTESVTIDDFVKVEELFAELKKLGFKICIDDFGTGYSSMTYLQSIPADNLKIDKCFIDEIPHDNNAASIVGAIIALAHSMNMGVVAEGVEKKSQFQYLKNTDCDEVQGYFLSKPLSQEEVIQFIESYKSV